MMTESGSNRKQAAEEESTYHAAEDQSLSEAVIHAVADFTGRETIAQNTNETQEALDSLSDTIDPDALDSLFQTAEKRDSMVGTVEFWYGGCEVTVQNTGLIIVTKR